MINQLRLRKEFLDRFGPLKDFIESLVKQRNSLIVSSYSRPIGANGQANRGFDQLTKNALQNVVQFFRPWGRDFTVLRLVNRKVRAAYTDHLKSVVNIGDYLQTVMSRHREENSAQLRHLIRYIVEGKLFEEEGKDWLGNEVGPKFLVERKEQKFVEQLVMYPYINAVEEVK